jgi:SAM-dependent methyltransferase
MLKLLWFVLTAHCLQAASSFQIHRVSIGWKNLVKSSKKSLSSTSSTRRSRIPCFSKQRRHSTRIFTTQLYLSNNDGVGQAENDSDAKSQFGTFQYWDDMYVGMGDFPQDEYSWYYGWEVIKPYFKEHVPVEKNKKKVSSNSEKSKQPNILIPGIGNDPILLDLLREGYEDLVAFDYTENAISRQEDLLSYTSHGSETVSLKVMDARKLDEDFPNENFDAILEKGALDAIYLSGDGNVEKAASELKRVLKIGGIFLSVSGVVPEELRREIFNTDDWEWIRDGSDDLKAGCFIWRRI